MHCAEVAREPAKAQPQHPRSEVRRGALGQDEEPRVVGDEVKAAKLLLGQPPDPAVAGLELERAGVPTHERQPVLAQHCDVAHTSPDQAPEGQIVVRAHQRIPADPLVGAHRGADRDLAQPSGNQLEHRLRRGRWACAPTMAPSTPFVQRPSSACRINQLPARKNWPCFRDTLPLLAAETRFSFALVDCDLQDSVSYCADTLWPRMVPGAVVAFDDYASDEFRGARFAVDAFVSGQTDDISSHGMLNRLYYARKTGGQG